MIYAGTHKIRPYWHVDAKWIIGLVLLAVLSLMLLTYSLAQALMRTYLVVLAVGLGLMLIAVVGDVLWRLTRRGQANA